MPPSLKKFLEAPGTHLAARILICSAFLVSGLQKATHFEAAVAETQALGLPLPTLATVATITVQLLGSLSVIVGWWSWIGSLALAGFTLAATLIAHAFWAAAPGEQAHQLATFLEHMGLIGAFILIAVASGTSAGGEAARG